MSYGNLEEKRIAQELNSFKMKYLSATMATMGEKQTVQLEK